MVAAAVVAAMVAAVMVGGFSWTSGLWIKMMKSKFLLYKGMGFCDVLCVSYYKANNRVG